MEGTLWKWTNYFSGWQPRWFVLEDGILSYYRSQEDVVNGCKGSVKMSVCDVTVHGTDNTRLDLIIPGEAHFYVKAATPQERQQWLVALGTSKACLTTNNRQSSNIIEEFPEEQLKAKKSELRLYCDLLMQQVHSVKQAVSNKDQQPNIGQLNESTSLLSATCDTFIQALEECMTMAHADTMNNIPQSPSRKSPTTRTVPWGPPSVQRSLSVESPGARKSGNTPDTDSGSTSTSGIVRGYIPSASAPSSRRSSRQSPSPRPLLDPNTPPIFPESPSTKANSLPNPDIEELPANLSVMSGDQSVTNGDRVPTIFSSTDKSFCQLTIGENGEVPTDAFLNACRTILPIFDKLNPTSFAPVMLDLGGNIKKLEQKFSIDRDAYSSIQAMILTEVAGKQHSHSSSATTAMLWLKRGLEFICEFLRELLSGVDDIMTASNTAYSRTLKPFHNFVNRGAYALAVKSAPTKPELYRHFSIDENDVALTAYQQHLEEDMKQYVAALDKLLANINAFYVTNDLDSQDMV